MVHSKTILAKLISILDGSPSAPAERRTRRLAPTLDGLEQRLVLSGMGHHNHHLVARLAASAQVSQAATTTTTTNPTATTTGATDTTGFPATALGGCNGLGGGVQDAQLTADLQKLRTDQNAVILGSTVTDAQRFALSNDLRTIAQSGVTIDKTALKSVADNLLTALADGSYDANADTAASIKTAFTAAFSGTILDQTAIDQAYTDFVVVARGLNVSVDELNTLTADRTAIHDDLTRLGITTTDGHGLGDTSALDLILGGGFGRGPGGGPAFRGGRRGRRG